MLQTTRLILRPFRPVDHAAYVAMMTDPAVADWLGGALSEEAASSQFKRMSEGPASAGLGWLAIERREDGRFLGAAALVRVHADRPLGGEIEIGWRLAASAWGGGYATEAALALVELGFRTLALERIVSFTADSNQRSQAVMRRLGMQRRPDLDFDHPVLAEDHPLRRHVVFVLENPG